MLTVDDLHFNYADVQVLNGLNMVGNEGELVGIVGPNGSGKTTILQIISGVLKPAHGRVVISDSDVAHLSTKEKAKLVSVVPQSPTLPPTFTVRELVLMGRNPHLRLLEWEGQTLSLIHI